MSALRALAAVAAIVAFAGCADGGLCLLDCDDALRVAAAEPAVCRVDDDCVVNGLGEVCRLADGTGTPALAPADGGTPATPEGICVIPATPTTQQVFLEVRPLATANLPLTQHGPVDTSRGQNQEIVLAPPLELSGTVRERGTGAAVAGAKVRFRGRSLIPGRSLSFETVAGDAGEKKGVYARTLPQGAYALVVTPPEQDGVLPPPERPLGDSMTAEISGPTTLDLEVTPPGQLVQLSGTATYESKDGVEAVAAGLDVWALEAVESARPKTLSQPARTDAQGRFTLWLAALPSGTTAWSVRLRFTPPPNAGEFPTFTLTRAFEVAESKDLGKVMIGRVPEIVVVTGKVIDAGASGAAEGKAVAGARVAFRSSEKDSFSFTASAFTDNAGNYTVRLLKGSYAALAVPPVDRANTGILPLAPCPHGSRVAPEPGLVVNFACERRRLLSGQLFKPGMGGRASGVAIVAVRRPDAELEDEMFEETVSDADGNFGLALAPGTYDVTLKPPPEAKLPFKTIRAIPFREPRTIVVHFDEPFELFGKLLGGAVPQAIEATIEAWAVYGEGADTYAVAVGRGVSQADGSYSIVLPAR